jgi:hypothetical protein
MHFKNDENINHRLNLILMFLKSSVKLLNKQYTVYV